MLMSYHRVINIRLCFAISAFIGVLLPLGGQILIRSDLSRIRYPSWEVLDRTPDGSYMAPRRGRILHTAFHDGRGSTSVDSYAVAKTISHLLMSFF